MISAFFCFTKTLISPSLYNGWNRDALSLQAWIYNFLPSKVKSLTNLNYKDVLSDSSPWIIDYFTPWCSHCQSFAPEFEKVAQVSVFDPMYVIF